VKKKYGSKNESGSELKLVFLQARLFFLMPPRHMVCQWDMNDKLGPVTFSQGETHPFLGREIAEHKDFSQETARVIDDEIRRIIREQEKKAEDLLESDRDKLDSLAEALLEHESMEKEEIDQLLGTIDSHSQAV
jgi:cell division protease FtsH